MERGVDSIQKERKREADEQRNLLSKKEGGSGNWKEKDSKRTIF